MDFYNLGEGRPQTFAAPDSMRGIKSGIEEVRESKVRNDESIDSGIDENGNIPQYLLKYVLGDRDLRECQRILFVEDEPRLHGVLRNLIVEENMATECEFTDSLDAVADLQKEKNFDLIVANYYEAEDEIDYEFWDQLRNDHPRVSVVTLSHINDREYYDLLDRWGQSKLSTTKSNLKHLFENVFGGWHGNY
jgi:CheY-like chemotaxis protein